MGQKFGVGLELRENHSVTVNVRAHPARAQHQPPCVSSCCPCDALFPWATVFSSPTVRSCLRRNVQSRDLCLHVMPKHSTAFYGDVDLSLEFTRSVSRGEIFSVILGGGGQQEKFT